MNSNRSQVLRIECGDLITIPGQTPDQTTSNTTTTERTAVSDTPTTDETTTSDTTKTEPTPDQSMIHYTATGTSKNVNSIQSATQRLNKGNN